MLWMNGALRLCGYFMTGPPAHVVDIEGRPHRANMPVVKSIEERGVDVTKHRTNLAAKVHNILLGEISIAMRLSFRGGASVSVRTRSGLRGNASLGNQIDCKASQPVSALVVLPGHSRQTCTPVGRGGGHDGRNARVGLR